MINMYTDQSGICSSAGERGHGRVEPVAYSHLQQDCQLRYCQVSCLWTSVLRIIRIKIRIIYLKNHNPDSMLICSNFCANENGEGEGEKRTKKEFLKMSLTLTKLVTTG